MRAGPPREAAAGGVLAALLLASCAARTEVFPTWASRGERPARTAPVAQGVSPPALAVPWAGTVSHHLLTDPLIDSWFAELAIRRNVKTFYVLSPSHWGLSTQPYSLTEGSWKTPEGFVESDRSRVRALAKALGVPLEPSVFEIEHGVSTLMPSLKRYFPHARVVALAYRGEPPLDQGMASRLSDALAPAFDAAGRRKRFLLISTDFSHHGDREATLRKDGRSGLFFQSPSRDTWIFAGCDNRPGIYCLSRLLGADTRCALLCHTDSWALSGQGPDDITSYFFSFFWDEP